MFNRLVLALVCLIIFGFIYRISFFKKEHFTTTIPTFNNILSKQFCTTDHAKNYRNGKCLTSSCPSEKCWELQSNTNNDGSYTHVENLSADMILTTETVPKCVTTNVSKCGDVLEPTCFDSLECHHWVKGDNNEWTQPIPSAFENTTMSFKENGSCPDRHELDATCPQKLIECALSPEEYCYTLTGDALLATNWAEHRVLNKRISSDHRCSSVISQSDTFVSKPENCKTRDQKDDAIQDAIITKTCGSEKCWSKESATISGLDHGKYFSITHHGDTRLRKDDSGNCFSRCENTPTTLPECLGLTCTSLELNEITNENEMKNVVVGSDIYIIDRNESPTCPTLTNTPSCIPEIQACDTIDEKCFIHNGGDVFNNDNWTEHAIFSRRIGQDNIECQKVINRGNTLNPVYTSVDAGCITEQDKNTTQCHTYAYPNCYVINTVNNKWKELLITEHNNCKVLPDNKSTSICNNVEHKNDHNYCRLEGIASNYLVVDDQVHTPGASFYGNEGGGGYYEPPGKRTVTGISTTEFSKVCDFASSSFSDKVFVKDNEWNLSRECSSVCSGKIGVPQTSGVIDCVCVNPPTSDDCTVHEWFNSSTSLCERSTSDEQCSSKTDNWIYDNGQCKEPVSPTQTEITTDNISDTQISILVTPPTGGDGSYYLDQHTVSISQGSVRVLEEDISQIGKFIASNLTQNTEYTFVSTKTYTLGILPPIIITSRNTLRTVTTPSNYTKHLDKAVWQHTIGTTHYGNVDYCKNICDETSECVGFVSNKIETICWMKNNVAGNVISTAYNIHEKSEAWELRVAREAAVAESERAARVAESERAARVAESERAARVAESERAARVAESERAARVAREAAATAPPANSTPPPDLTGYTLQSNKQIWTSHGQNIGVPRKGTPETCKGICDALDTCKGFTTNKRVNLQDTTCWMKNDVVSNVRNDTIYNLYTNTARIGTPATTTSCDLATDSNNEGKNPTRIRLNGMCFEKMHMAEFMTKLKTFGINNRNESRVSVNIRLKAFDKNGTDKGNLNRRKIENNSCPRTNTGTLIGGFWYSRFQYCQELTLTQVLDGSTIDGIFYLESFPIVNLSNSKLRIVSTESGKSYKAAVGHTIGSEQLLFIPDNHEITPSTPYSTDIQFYVAERGTELFFIMEWKSGPDATGYQDTSSQKYLRLDGEEVGITDFVGTNPDINGHNLLYFQAYSV
jgi:hypothetical protein